MKKWRKKITALVITMLVHTIIFAQNDTVEMATTMRSNGKIYIVVAVCLTILLGLFLYVWNIDRKISASEKE